MKLATTTEDFCRYCPTIAERVSAVCDAGFRYIDLSMYNKSTDAELILSDDWKSNAEKLLEHTKRLGAKFVQAHSPGGNPFNEEKYGDLIDITIRSIEVCGILGIPNIVVHSGEEKGLDRDAYYEKNRIFYNKLIPAMEATGVNVLIENSTVANMGDKYFFFKGDDMKCFLDWMDHPLLHACWDTGHANIEGSQYDDILALGDHLRAVHINDNRGKGDEHIIPYLGTINMDEVMHALIDSNYKGYFTFECGSSMRPKKYWLGNRRDFDKDTRLASPTFELQKKLESFMHEVGLHILNSYNCYED